MNPLANIDSIDSVLSGYFTRFGYANTSGVFLLDNDDPLPGVTEEEERFHSALIGNTSYGMIQILFASIKASTIDIHNLFKKYFLLSLCNAREIHEACSKYLAILMAAYRYQYRELQLIKNLHNENVKNYSIIIKLDSLLGEPLIEDSDWGFRKEFVYSLAKICLSTNMMESLSRITYEELRNSILKENIWDKKSPNELFRILLEKLSSNEIDKIKNQYYKKEKEKEDDLGIKAANSIYDNLFEIATPIFLSKNTKLFNVLDRRSLINSALQFSYNLNSAFADEIEGHFFKKVSTRQIKKRDGSWEVKKLDPSTDIAEPSCNVFRLPHFQPHSFYIPLSPDNFLKKYKKSPPDIIVALPLFDTAKNNESLYLYIFPRNIKNSELCESNNLQSAITIHFVDMESLISFLQKLILGVNILLLQKTDYDQDNKEIAGMFGKPWMIVFINLQFKLELKSHISVGYFSERQDSLYLENKKNISTRFLNCIVIHDEKNKYCYFSCVPLYITDLIQIKMSKGIIENVDFHNDYKNFTGKYLACGYPAEIAFNISYIQNMLPEGFLELGMLTTERILYPHYKPLKTKKEMIFTKPLFNNKQFKLEGNKWVIKE